MKIAAYTSHTPSGSVRVAWEPSVIVPGYRCLDCNVVDPRCQYLGAPGLAICLDCVDMHRARMCAV